MLVAWESHWTITISIMISYIQFCLILRMSTRTWPSMLDLRQTRSLHSKLWDEKWSKNCSRSSSLPFSPTLVRSSVSIIHAVACNNSTATIAIKMIMIWTNLVICFVSQSTSDSSGKNKKKEATAWMDFDDDDDWCD